MLLDFWGGWSAPCRSMLPELQQLYKKNEAVGLEVLGINVNGDLAGANATDLRPELNLDIPWPQLHNRRGF